MSYLRQAELGEAYPPFVALRAGLGFLPRLFLAQTLLPRVIEAEAGIAGAVLLKEDCLTRLQKEALILGVAAAYRNRYCVAAHARTMQDLEPEAHLVERLVAGASQAGPTALDDAARDFSLKLARTPSQVGPDDLERLRALGLSDRAILEVILTTALGRFLCALSVGLGVEPDFPGPDLPPVAPPADREGGNGHPGREGAGPYLQTADLGGVAFPPFAFFQDRFGFIPGIFRAQSLRPDVIAAEAEVVRQILLTEDVLPRVVKESILLVVSGANLNSYCIAVHCELLRRLGMPVEQADRIAYAHERAGLPAPQVRLLDFALKLSQDPGRISAADVDALRGAGYDDPEILEAVVMTAVSHFLNTVQAGVGSVHDFPPRVSPPAARDRPTSGIPPAGAAPEPDPDVDLVRQAREGSMAAFETLVLRHQRRLYRALRALTGNREDAEDAVQGAFFKAYRHLPEFRGSSRFATWLTRIAVNEGMDALRRRRPAEARELRETAPEAGAPPPRPRDLGAWPESPESLLSRRELQRLVHHAVDGLPPRYRAAVVLRDLLELPTAEAAALLGVPLATVKTHILRGRLLLRDALAPSLGAPSAPEAHGD